MTPTSTSTPRTMPATAPPLIEGSALAESGWGVGDAAAEDEVRLRVEPSVVWAQDSVRVVGVVVNVAAMLPAAVWLTVFQKMICTTIEPL